MSVMMLMEYLLMDKNNIFLNCVLWVVYNKYFSTSTRTHTGTIKRFKYNNSLATLWIHVHVLYKETRRFHGLKKYSDRSPMKIEFSKGSYI